MIHNDYEYVEAFKEEANEINDGLFVFIAQAEHVVDMCVYRSDDKDLFIIDLYTFTNKEESAEIYNFSDLTKNAFKDNEIYQQYTQDSTIACDDRDEAYQLFFDHIKTLNKSCF
jgi:hypothetical protein